MTTPPITPGPAPTPPQQPIPPIPIVPQPRKPNNQVGWILGIVAMGSLAACLGLVVIGHFFGDESGGGSSGSSKRSDVTLTSCEPTRAGNGRATLSIKNSASRERDYRITVHFTDSSGTRVGDGFAYVTDVAPGQTVKEDVVGLLSGDASRCRIDEVD